MIEIAVRRAVFTIMLMGGLVVFGILGLGRGLCPLERAL